MSVLLAPCVMLILAQRAMRTLFPVTSQELTRVVVRFIIGSLGDDRWLLPVYEYIYV